ncbi:unnamed protein product [Sphenostylis stenocarpa]|uniref:AAA+ ATPase domain-containing protein n=1 Tax=Sphenostylis stenocarpa TaxID=92480 RepID=A0AA86V1F5_9FABA|nr:unnamed protein product [Sphenostylis stenocarpa]
MDPNTVVSTATGSVLKFGGDLVTRHMGYFYNYKDKFEAVNRCIEMLDDTRKRVQNEVMAAEMNAEEIEEDVQHWLKYVDEKIKEYENFLCDKCHEKTRRSIRFFPNNMQLRYRLGRRATKILEEIKADELLNKKFDKVSYHIGPSMDAALSNTGYESFASRKKIMGMIMQALEDSTVSMIGVYGVGGVGKTTLVKEVAKEAKEKKLFNTVVMANISRNPDIEKVQGQIAETLGMRLEEESEIVRADRIRKRLKKEKENTLIILDDLWSGLDLNRLGIPQNEDNGVSQKVVKDAADFGYSKVETEKLSFDSNKTKKDKLSSDYNKIKNKLLSVDRKGCKIVLTSRNKEVLCNQMDVQERSTFSLGVLDQKEAEALLKKISEINVTNSAFDEKVTEISKMCAGLPIALISIGKTLKNKSPFVWEDVCRQIERQNFTGGQESIEFSAKLSYDHLKNELKHIFLQCARMGSDFSTMDLVKFCIGLEMLQGVYTIRETKSRVNVLLEELIESSLLVKSYSNDCFNMHDIVRDVALSISYTEKSVFFMKNGKLNEWPHKDKLERYTAIVLHYCDIVELPESIYCPRLEIFHIDSKDYFLKIPDDFFEDMVELKVLVLTGVNLSPLPSSIKRLTNLKMLCLERCTLRNNLSIMGELKKLRILSLSGSNIENLPVGMGQLDKLQLLDLSYCSKLRVIPSNIISRLSSLEEFYMRDDLILRETKEEILSKNVCLCELRHLNQLRSLDIHIPSVAHFPQNLFFDKLDSYKIVIGEINMLSVGEFKIPDKYEAVKFLALNLKDGINIHSEKRIKILFKKVEYLLLGELNDVQDVFYELNVEGFQILKHLFIVNNFCLQYIINSVNRFDPLLAFPKLESMCLYKLENLEKICDNQLTEASFSRLKIIKIKTCDQLEYIFSFFMFSRLTMLETIEVCDCDSLKEIVHVERESDSVSDVQTEEIEFPQLRFLTLQSLPAFFCFYTNDKMPSISQSSQEQVQNKELKEITAIPGRDTNACLSLFNGKVALPKLEWLELSSINIPQIWNDKSLHSFESLLTLNVSDCGNLKYLFSVSMSGSLVNLQSLFVSGCELMEDIFSAEDAMNIDIFPKLKKMEINCMEKLNTLWQPYIGFHSFHSLDSLIIRECNKLVTIFPSYTGEGFQSLQSLVITDCMSVETIFDFGNISQTCSIGATNLHDVFLEELPKLVHIWKVETDGILNFNNLQSVVVYESKMIKYAFPLSVAKGLEKLETLDVCNCEGMKEVVACDYQSNEQIVTFSKLEETTNLQLKSIFLATEKVIHNLEYMSISLKEAEWLRDYNFSHRMHKLQSLVLSGLKNTDILFWLLHRLPNLESITLKNCLFEGVWGSTGLAAHKTGVVVQLTELIINNLSYLQNIGFEHDLLLQRVERLVISGCVKLKSLLPSSVSFSYLTYLEVTECSGLRILMTSSTAMTLVQLTIMKVKLCQGIEKIVAEEEKTQVIEFRQLKAIELVSLQSLTCFCSSKKCDLKFPSLENLVVSDCPLMETFSKVQSAPNLRKMHVAAGEKDRWYWEGDLNTTLRKLSTDKVYSLMRVLVRSKEEAVLVNPFIILPLEISWLGTKDDFFETFQVSFKHSKHLRLKEDSELKVIWQGKAAFQENYFGSLKTLVVTGITKDHVIPSQVLTCLKNLEELKVESCRAVEVIFNVNDIDMKKKGIVSRLKMLTLNKLPNLNRVWNKNPRGIVSFPNMQEVSVFDCGQLATLFPSSLAISLVKLQILEIQWCEKLVEIVEKEDAAELGTAEIFKFPCLTSLLLFHLPLLSCFYPGKHHLLCPMLECLDVSYCPNLKLFTSKFHDSHKEAVTESQVSAPIATSRRQQPLFSVEELPELDTIGLEHPWVKPYSEKLELLKLENCPRLEKLVGDVVSFINLKKLAVNLCKEMKYLFTVSTAKTLVQLEILSILNCKSIKEIVKKEDEDTSEEIIFGRLKTLTLNSLSRLVRFYSGNAILQLSCLRTAKIVKCPKMITFSEGGIKAPMFSGIKTSSKDVDVHFHNDLNSTVQWCFREQDSLKHSKHLTIAKDSKLTKIWHSKDAFQDNHFRSLTKLVVKRVEEDHVLPSQILHCLKNLKKLKVESCREVEVIFDINGIDRKKKGIVSGLKKLTLKNLPSLKCVWNKTPQGIVSFPNLQEVSVSRCSELATLFPSSLARNLVKLEELDIQNCDKLVDIVGNDDGIELDTTKMFKFPCLTSLLLFRLPLLTCFYPRKHRLLCPILESLDVSFCPNLKLFTSEFHDSYEALGVEIQVRSTIKNIPLQQPMFSVEKVIPKLKELTVNEKNIILLNALLPQDLLCKLNHLQLCLEGDFNGIPTFLFYFFLKLPSLEHLQLSYCDRLRKLFPDTKHQIHDRILSRLKKLTLDNLEKLNSIGLKHPRVKPYSERLESFVLKECPRVKTIVSGTVSFMNMKELFVTDCKKMQYLFKFSTAKSLVQLVILSIQNCESIKEIVKEENENGSDEIIFARVKTLELVSLPLLGSFYSGYATLQFSRLKKVKVAECRKMETFSQGDIKAPFFYGIQTSVDDFDLTFHEDLNTTIKKLFDQMVEGDSTTKSMDGGISHGHSSTSMDGENRDDDTSTTIDGGDSDGDTSTSTDGGSSDGDGDTSTSTDGGSRDGDTSTATGGGSRDGDTSTSTGGGSRDGDTSTSTDGGSSDGDTSTSTGGGSRDGDTSTSTGGGSRDGDTSTSTDDGSSDGDTSTSMDGGNSDDENLTSTDGGSS